MPRSVNLGKIFSKHKVKHVLCFDEPHSSQTPDAGYDPEELAHLIRFQFNYIYNFCEQFYSGLANEKTVIEAFKDA